MAKIALPPLDEDQRTAVKATATQIAEALHETKHGPKAMLWRVVRVLGPDAAQALLTETQQMEAKGGMLTVDQSRRRTPGRVFFFLARQRLQGQPTYLYVFLPNPSPAKKNATAAPPPTQPVPSAPVAPLVWAERSASIAESLTQPGESRTMKVSLLSRPGKVVDKGDFILTAMPAMKLPAFPKGIPVPAEQTQTQIAVFIAKKQWKKVADAIANLDDALLVEGFAVYEPQINGMAVLATNVTTKLLQQAKRQTSSTEA
jgi:hypothetical protein